MAKTKSALSVKAFNTVKGTDGFTRAKTLAKLALEQNVGASGERTAKGYEEAIAILEPYIESANPTQAAAAQLLVAQYQNDSQAIKEKKGDVAQKTAAFKLREQSMYFRSADEPNGDRAMRNPTALVAGSSQDLTALEFEVQNAIDELAAEGKSTADLETYMYQLGQRASMMRELHNDLISGEVPQEQLLKGYGYFIDADQNDGSINRAGILPTLNLPDKIAENFKAVDAVSNVGGAKLQVHSIVPPEKDSAGNFKTRIGGVVFAGTDGSMPLRKKANESTVDFEGDFSIDNDSFAARGGSLRQLSFSRGITGINEDGSYAENYFFTDKDGNTFTVKPDELEQYKADPLLKTEIDRARLLDSNMARGLSASDKVQPLNPDLARDNLAMMAPPEVAPAEEPSFFQKAGNVISEAAGDLSRGVGTVKSFFGDRVNRQSTPQEAPTGRTGKTIIEAGKEFFSGLRR